MTLWKRVGQEVQEGKKRKIREGRIRGRKGFGYGVSQGAGPGNTNMRGLLPDRRYTGAVLDFPETTRRGSEEWGRAIRRQ